MSHIRGFFSLHLAQGTKCPELSYGKLRLYNMRFCPFAQRTLLVLLAKNIQFEIVNVHLKDKPDWFLKKNPLGKVPVLELNGRIFYESAICNEWLDAEFPQNRILPQNADERAWQKMLAEELSQLQSALYPWLRHPEDPKTTKKLRRKIELHEITLDGKDYLTGFKCGYVDYMQWPWIERLLGFSHLGVFSYCKELEINEAQYPNLVAYGQRMNQRAEVKACRIEPELQLKFIESLLNKQPDYDLGLTMKSKC